MRTPSSANAATTCLPKKDALPWISPTPPAGLMAVLANTPSRMMPSNPPTPWTPQTSSASSQRSRFLSCTA